MLALKLCFKARMILEPEPCLPEGLLQGHGLLFGVVLGAASPLFLMG